MQEEKIATYISEDENKFVEFIKKNILNFLIVAVIIVFLFKDLIDIEKSGKTIVEIIANSVINLIVGQLIKNLFMEKGSIAGTQSNKYRKMMNRYGDEIEKSDERVNLLDDFCDYKNEQRLAKAQKHVLRPARIKYTDFVEKRKEEVCRDKAQYKAWDKAEKVKIQILTPENLVSETDDKYDKGKKEESMKSHKAKAAGKSFIIAAGISVIFGYFVPSLNKDIVAGLIWNLVQVGIWLAFGIIAYYQEYTYITIDYAQRILRKITYLVEFNNEKGEWNNGIDKENKSNKNALQSSESNCNC